MKLRVSAVLASGILALLLALACNQPERYPQFYMQPGSPDEYQTYRDIVNDLREEIRSNEEASKEFQEDTKEYQEKLSNVNLEAKRKVNEIQREDVEKEDEARAATEARADDVVDSKESMRNRRKEYEQDLDSSREEAKQKKDELDSQLQAVEAHEADNLLRSETLETTADQQARAAAKLKTNSDFRQLQNEETRFDQTEAQSLAGARQKIKDLQHTKSSLESRWAEANERRGEAIESLGILQDRLAQEQSCSPALHKHLSAVAQVPITQAKYPQPGDVPMTGYMMADNISNGLKKCGGN